MKEQTILQRIIKWNEERNLLTPIEDNKTLDNNLSFIVEEVIEAKSEVLSEVARPLAIRIVSKISSSFFNKERIVDAFCDIIVFATGAIRKLGYDPDIAMDETLKEIESRVGSVQDGKFVKDKSPEAVANWYKADYTKAEI